MKCPRCNGTGYVKTISVGGVPCSTCNGTGKIVQTNKEYMQTCSSDELANTIFRLIVHGTVIRPDREYIKKWLKEEHKDA